MTITDVVALGSLHPLAYVRQSRGWTQRELERRAGLPATTVCQIERGYRNPDPGTMVRLAMALGIDDPELIFPRP